MNVLVVNVGSSSVKLDVVAPDDSVLERARIETLDGHDDAIERFADAVGDRYDVVGHRVVHGGPTLATPCRVDDRVLGLLDEASELAPLHNPPAVAAIRRFLRRDDRPNVACFDTTFHAAMTEAARTYAVPPRWRDELGVRRFGFHGLSHAWAARRTAALLGDPAGDHRIVTCHLGAGASLAAVHGGRSLDTTMGFTPVEGLVMAHRSGDVDPGALSWLVARGHLRPDELDDQLNHASGLLGLAGTDDMRTVLERRRDGDDDARLAVEVYVHRLVKAIAGMAAVLGGLDAVTFTGGVGERAPEVRRLACRGLAFLGVALDEERNAHVTGEGDVDVTASGAGPRTLVVHAREELEIAREVRDVPATATGAVTG